jgi:hypothetical protein
MSQTVRIVDQARKVVAVAQVEDKGSYFSGAVDLDPMPADLRQRFEEYESIVNDQVFSLLDAIEGQISALSFKAVFDDGREILVEDLQIFPKGGTVSFRPAKEAAA